MKIPDRENALKILNEKYLKTRFKTPEKVVEVWQTFVNQIVKGKYNGNENEYLNDLDTRLVIEEIGYDETEEVKKIDEEFRKVLIYTNVRNWGYDKTRTDDWWNFGYPNTVTGYLKDYFESGEKQHKT